MKEPSPQMSSAWKNKNKNPAGHPIQNVFEIEAMEDVAEIDESSKDRPAKQISDEKNESGIGVDLNESESCDNHTAYSLSINSETEMSSSPENRNDLSAQAISMSVDQVMPDVSEETSLNCSGMKKDDSGIYSEKSPACGLVKEISDGDLTESITESFEENASLEHRCKMSVGLDEGDIFQSEDNDAIDASEDHKITDINDVPEKVKKSDNVNANNAKDMNDKCEALNSDSLKQSLEVDDPSDQDDDSDPDIVKPLHRKFVKPLVDYESSDSESAALGEPARKPFGKCYRKRKSDSKESSDDEVDDEDESSAVDDGTPVLLRQGGIREPDNEDMFDMDSDDNSDTSDAELETRKDSSESEPDDTPIDVSPFGPPKHKWRALFDLRDREHGFTVRSEPGYFRKKIQGSLQMVQRFELLYKMEHHEGCVNALHFNGTGTLLASGSDDLNIVIWNWTRNKPALIYDSGHRSNVFQSKFMPFSGDCHVVSCARDGQIRLADLSSTGVCKSTRKLAQHRGSAHKLALEMDSPHVFLSCGEDAITLEIDLRCDKANKLVVTKENDRKVALYSIHSNPCNSKEFVVSGRDHFIRIYDKRKINEEVDDGIVKKFCPHHLMTGDKPDTKANVTCACYNHNGTEVLGTYNDEDIYLFRNTDSDGANYSHKYKGHRNNQTVKGVNFYGPESEFVVSGSDCGHIFLWHKATENVVTCMAGDDGGVINVLEPHPLLPVLATSGLDHDVKIWTPTGDSSCQTAELKKLIKKNSREREEERSSDVGMVDGAMLWYLMHHLRRGRRQREREARRARGESPEEEEEAEDDDEDEEDTVSEESSHSESDGEIGPHERIQCAPS